MPIIDAVVTGERDIALRLERMPERLRARLVATITTLTNRLYASVIAAEPSRTGKLRSETRMRIDQTQDAVRGHIAVVGEFAKAGALEYGAHRKVSVRSFDRQGHTPFGAPAEQMVAAYSRQANILARRFERGPLEAMQGEIAAALEAAVRDL